MRFFLAIQFSGTNLTLNGSGGVQGWQYDLLASTNLALPAVQWVRLATNQFDADGNFSLTITNAIDPSQPQTFYKLQLQ